MFCGKHDKRVTFAYIVTYAVVRRDLKISKSTNLLVSKWNIRILFKIKNSIVRSFICVIEFK